MKVDMKDVQEDLKRYQGEIDALEEINKGLVVALKELAMIVEIHSGATNNKFAWAEMEQAEEALVRAKGYE